MNECVRTAARSSGRGEPSRSTAQGSATEPRGPVKYAGRTSHERSRCVLVVKRRSRLAEWVDHGLPRRFAQELVELNQEITWGAGTLRLRLHETCRKSKRRGWQVYSMVRDPSSTSTGAATVTPSASLSRILAIPCWSEFSKSLGLDAFRLNVSSIRQFRSTRHRGTGFAGLPTPGTSYVRCARGSLSRPREQTPLSITWE